ncbi:MAG: four helix bundle protein [Nitrospiraceae bacterium]|nr:MAG: four helix bundle protein [Nitrospiraceae bacterium]
MKRNVSQDKSYVFALRIIKTYEYLCVNKKEHVLSKQLLRSGNSIGANLKKRSAVSQEKTF